MGNLGSVVLGRPAPQRVHARWAMLGAAGVLAQEIVKPDVFWYTAGAEVG
jgi:hypothetical protein